MFFNAEITQTYMIPEYKSEEEAIKLFDRFKELSVSKDHFVYGIYLNDRIIGFINDVEIKEKEIEINITALCTRGACLNEYEICISEGRYTAPY